MHRRLRGGAHAAHPEGIGRGASDVCCREGRLVGEYVCERLDAGI